MPHNCEQPPQPKSGNAWVIGFAALFVGYLLGQNSTPASPSPSSEQTTPVPVTSNAAAAAKVPVGAQLAAGADTSLDAIAEAPADETDLFADETSATDYQPAYAYAQTPPYTQSSDAETATTGAQVASPPADTIDAAVDGAAATAGAAAPRTSYQSTGSVSTYQAPRYSYAPVGSDSAARSKCQGVGCYGVTSTVNGLPRTTYVRGYTRKDGTYVQPHYRSRRRS